MATDHGAKGQIVVCSLEAFRAVPRLLASMSRKRLLLTVAVAGLLVLAGCTGADDVGDAGGDVGDATEEEVAVERDAAVETDDAASDDYAAAVDGDVDPAALAADRQLIRTGELRLTVAAFDDAEDEVRRTVDDRRGFVSETRRETVDRGDGEHTLGELVIRVPSEEFDATMADLERIGEVETSSTETEDVSDQLTDIEARLENLRAERDRLRALYEDANETADVLTVQSELSNTQERIERLEARQASLEERVALSTIRVELSEEPPEPAEPVAWYDTDVVTAFLESVRGVGTVLQASIVGAAYAAPYALAFGIPLVVVGALARRVGCPLSVADGDE